MKTPFFIKVKKIESNRIRKFKLKSILLAILLLTAIVMLLLILFALNNGVGYEGKVNVTSTKLLVEGHPCAGVECICDVDMRLNPFLYPISHVSGRGKVSGVYSFVYYPISEHGIRVNLEEIEDSALGSLVWGELMSNLPYLLVVSFLIGLVIIKLIQIAKKKFAREKEASESQLKLGDAWGNR